MFLVRPKPKEDEALESYIIRLVKANGYSSLGMFLRTIGALSDFDKLDDVSSPKALSSLNLYHSQISSQRRIEIIKTIAKLADTAFSEIYDICLSRSSVNFSNGRTGLFRKGVVVPRSQLLPLDSVRICPKCIDEALYIRQIWSFEAYSTCHIHNVPLIDRCSGCGSPIEIYRELTCMCKVCGMKFSEVIGNKLHESDFLISAWLAGQYVEKLPDVSISHRWGLHTFYTDYISGQESRTEGFINFFTDWPKKFISKIDQDTEYRLSIGLKPVQESTFQEVFGSLLVDASKLPARNMSENIVLRAIFSHLYEQTFDKKSPIGSVIMNSLEVSILLNSSTEQVAALFEQGLLQAYRRVSSKSAPSIYTPLFRLENVMSVWLTSYQSPSSNIRHFTSRW